MFGKKSHADVKKSTQKFLDSKKDTTTRLKHLRIVIDHVEGEEASSFFETHSTLIYYLLCDIIAAAETTSKQRDLTFHLVHKIHREELDSALIILEQLLLHLPELLGRGWQQHALLRTLCKLLHPGNSLKLRRDAIRYFIIWYQALGENAPEEVDAVFATLVPGFAFSKPGLGIPSSPLPFIKGGPANSIFHDTNPGSLTDLQPVLTPQSGEKPPEEPMKYFLDVLLDSIVSQVNKVEWKEKLYKAHKSFSFLLERFKKYYLPHIFPAWNDRTSLYPPSLDLPQWRRSPPNIISDGDIKDPLISCRVAVIKWVASFTHITKKDYSNVTHSNSLTPDTEHLSGDLRRVSVNQIPPVVSPNVDQYIPFSSLSDLGNESETAIIVREVLYSTRENVCFVLEVYRQAFLLPFSHAHAIRRVISVYKDWIQTNVPDLPPFIFEPIENSEANESELRLRLRNDSYLGAVHKDYMLIRAGVQNTLQLFITHAANVFLSQVKNLNLLEEQVDTCKRVLNIYRYMVMQSKMELKTWEQLLAVLLHITGLVLSKTPPKHKEDTLGGKLAQAIFQTLIVTWIKANLNVVISTALWDDFLALLTSLTQWEELIKEWAKTLETLTRVLARHVYSLDLTDLPLDRLSEQQAKKRRGIKSSSQTDGPKPLMGRKGSSKLLKSHQNSLPETSTTPDTSGSFQFCSVRKRMDSLNEYPSHFTPVVKCSSEGNLINTRRRRWKRQSLSTNKNNVVIPVLPVTLVNEVNKLLRGSSLPAPNLPRNPWLRKWRSADSLRYEDSPALTRSPSPAPSSGVETSSIKDSPMPLDFVATDSSSLDCNSNGGRSVMAGGTITGWLPDVAVVLWRRMLGALGDINKITDPALHAQVFHHLLELWETLVKIYANQGVPEEGITPTPPVLVPPLTIFAPWCFKALELPESYQKGKLSAYRLLCRMTLEAGTWALSHTILSHLYRSLHSGLCGSQPLIMWTVLKSLGPRFLTRQLPGYSLLLLDLISASNAVLESSDLQIAPRREAISILGSILSLPYMVSQAPSLDPRSPALSILKCAGAKDHVLASLLKCAKREPTGLARCIALSTLAVFAYTELFKISPHPTVIQAFDVILLALKFKQQAVSFVACDLLLMLSDHISTLLEKFPQIPPKVLQFLAHTLGSSSNAGSLEPMLALTLGEWTMKFPISILLAQRVPEPLLLTIFKVLTELMNGATVVDIPPVEFSKEILCEWENNIKVDDLKTPLRKMFAQSTDKNSSSLACRAILMHLVSHLGHFPMGLGAARLSSLVQEQDDVPHLGSELSTKLFYAPNIQFMLVRNSLMSMIEVESLPSPGGGFTAGLITAPCQARVIFRDLANKASWDASALYCSPQDLPCSRKIPKGASKTNRQKIDDPPMSLMMASVPPRGTLRHRPPHILPTFHNGAPDMDNLHDLLRYIGHTSPECLENPDQELSEPGLPPPFLNRQTEAEVISLILAQRTLENDYKQYWEPTKPCVPPVHENCKAPFQHCRQLFSQLGLAGWERRSQIQLLARSEKLIRELKNLDTQRGRETHKIAVIYVAIGQEDKVSILSNKGGSQAYEQFVAGLAWEVELASHTGFNGGLNAGCGDTAPYYATAFVETLFHVATRMPSDTEEALLQKMRHLGNDEVHIVWSEHTRDYRRSSLPTEFCDVLIVVYPLPDSLYRIVIDTKSDMPSFGPLWNEAIVEGKALSGLVRAAALSASRAKRRILPHYQNFYEERSKSLSGVISNHKDPQSFEEFIAAVYTPGLPALPPRSVQPPLAKLADVTKNSESKGIDKLSPQQSKKLSFRPESESPIFSRIK